MSAVCTIGTNAAVHSAELMFQGKMLSPDEIRYMLHRCTCGVCMDIICAVLVYICIIILATCELHVLHTLMSGLLFP